MRQYEIREEKMRIHELHEGFLDWFSSDKPADMKKDVIPMVKQLLKKGMPENKIIAKVEKELHVRPRYVKQAITMVQAGINEVQMRKYEKREKEMKIYEIVETNADTFKKGAKDAEKLSRAAVDMHSKADAAMANSPVSKTQQYKGYKKTSQQKKIAAMKKGMPYGRQDVDEDASKGAAILARIDMALDGSGLKRQGFELVKDPNSFTRGSITREAEAAIRNSLAKAKAMLGGVEPEDPKPTISKADITDKDFGVGEGMYETTSSSIAVAPVAVGNTMQKRNPDGTAVNAQDQNTNLMGGKKKPNKKKKA